VVRSIRHKGEGAQAESRTRGDKLDNTKPGQIFLVKAKQAGQARKARGE